MKLRYIWRQIMDMTLASLKARYRKTWAGFLWVIFNPILMFGVQSLVFKKFLRLDIPNYYLFLLGGLLPWIFFSSTIQMGTPIFVTHSHLLRSFKVNPLVILGSQILDNFINFAASFFIVLLPFYLISDQPIYMLAIIPLGLIPLLLGTLSFTMILSTLNVFYRDVNFVMGFIFSLLFFLTPIFYPREFVPEQYQWLIAINPIIYFIEPFRALLHAGSISEFLTGILQGLGLALASFALAVWVWKRKVNDFYRKL